MAARDLSLPRRRAAAGVAVPRRGRVLFAHAHAGRAVRRLRRGRPAALGERARRARLAGGRGEGPAAVLADGRGERAHLPARGGGDRGVRRLHLRHRLPAREGHGVRAGAGNPGPDVRRGRLGSRAREPGLPAFAEAAPGRGRGYDPVWSPAMSFTTSPFTSPPMSTASAILPLTNSDVASSHFSPGGLCCALAAPS